MIDHFQKQIKTMSDFELGKSLNRMIKIRSEISNSLIDQHRKKDADCKITLMDKEWRRRGRKS